MASASSTSATTGDLQAGAVPDRGAGPAEDLAADAFVRAWTARDRLRHATVRAYLLTITRNLYRDRLRAARQFVELDEAVHDDSAARLERWSTLRDLRARLTRIAPGDRRALLLYAVREMSYAEIAQRLGVSLNAVKSRIGRARDALHARAAHNSDEFFAADPEFARMAERFKAAVGRSSPSEAERETFRRTRARVGLRYAAMAWGAGALLAFGIAVLTGIGGRPRFPNPGVIIGLVFSGLAAATWVASYSKDSAWWYDALSGKTD
jgi:RNA polymerase sigma-70 factor (ECF subfamily)